MTLKEAAEVLGLTKAGVMYHLRMMGVSADKDAKGRIIITEDMIGRIRDSMETAKRKVQSTNSAQSETANLAETSRKPELTEILQTQISVKDSEIAKLHEEIAKLNDQLSAKDAQIAEKDKQLGNLTDALAAAQRTAEGSQALHAASVKMLQDAVAEDSQAEPEEDPDEEKAPSPQEPPQKKRGLWARLFGRS